MENKIKWCFKRAGAKFIDSNQNISESFLELSEQTLKSAEMTLKAGDLVWSTSMIYYAEYYSIYSFLSRVGVKCENHDCSIEIAEFLLSKEIDIGLVRKAKELRINRVILKLKIFLLIFLYDINKKCRLC